MLPFVRLQFIFLFSVISHTPVTYGDYSYPGWAVGVGWVFALCSMVPLPTITAIKIARAEGPLLQVSLECHRYFYKPQIKS